MHAWDPYSAKHRVCFDMSRSQGWQTAVHELLCCTWRQCSVAFLQLALPFVPWPFYHRVRCGEICICNLLKSAHTCTDKSSLQLST